MNTFGQAGGTRVPVFSYRDSRLAIEQGDTGNFIDFCFQLPCRFYYWRGQARNSHRHLIQAPAENAIIKCIIRKNKWALQPVAQEQLKFGGALSAWWAGAGRMWVADLRESWTTVLTFQGLPEDPPETMDTNTTSFIQALHRLMIPTFAGKRRQADNSKLAISDLRFQISISLWLVCLFFSDCWRILLATPHPVAGELCYHHQRKCTHFRWGLRSRKAGTSLQALERGSHFGTWKLRNRHGC